MKEERKQFNLFVRGATLVSFAVLMGSFVAFKAGLFESAKGPHVIPVSAQKEPKAQKAPDVHLRNTTQPIPPDNRVQQNVADRALRDYMMVSSKTIVVAKSVDWSNFLFDRQYTSGPGGMIGSEGFSRESVMMSSSKSTHVFETRHPAFSGEAYDVEQEKLKKSGIRQGHK